MIDKNRKNDYEWDDKIWKRSKGIKKQNTIKRL
jgi:hypothetical protein